MNFFFDFSLPSSILSRDPLFFGLIRNYAHVRFEIVGALEIISFE